MLEGGWLGRGRVRKVLAGGWEVGGGGLLEGGGWGGVLEGGLVEGVGWLEGGLAGGGGVGWLEMGWRGVEFVLEGLGRCLREGLEGCWVVDGLGWRGGWLERGRFEGVGGTGKVGWRVGGWLEGGLNWGEEAWLKGGVCGAWRWRKGWVWLEGGREGGLAGGG